MCVAKCVDNTNFKSLEVCIPNFFESFPLHMYLRYFRQRQAVSLLKPNVLRPRDLRESHWRVYLSTVEDNVLDRCANWAVVTEVYFEFQDKVTMPVAFDVTITG